MEGGNEPSLRFLSHKKGFTLIELVIVIVIIGIVAAFGVPHLLRNKIVANESSAITTLNAYVKTEIIFYHTRNSLTGGLKYWTNDVAGLYYLTADGINPMGDLNKEIADSDYKFTCTAPEGYTYKGCTSGSFTPSPKSGYYVAVITKYNDIRLSTPVSASEYGLIAAPEIYEHTGNHVFVVNKRGEKFKSDGGGKSASDILGNDYQTWSNLTHPLQGNNPIGSPWTGLQK
ncbi:MAG: DUF2950 family protein [Planctomycetota bacterium]